MNLRTFVALLRGGQLAVLPAVGRATRDYHRVAFLAAGLRSGWLHRLSAGPVPLDALAAERLRALLHQSPRNFGHATSLWSLELAAEVSFAQGLTPE